LPQYFEVDPCPEIGILDGLTKEEEKISFGVEAKVRRHTNRFTETKPSLLLENPYSLPAARPKTCSNVIFVRSRAFKSPLRLTGELKMVENALR